MYFPVADLEISPFIPPLVACCISFFTSMAGVSGAFLLLPFQVSVLGFNSPAVSSTNHLFNVIAIPSGIYRFIKEGRMVWPLTWLVVIGTLPGVLGGVLIRVSYLPSPKAFKIFVGLVLLYIGIKLLLDIIHKKQKRKQAEPQQQNEASKFAISDTRLTWKSMQYRFEGTMYQANTFSIISLSLIVGLVGGIYGIGGGAIIAPFFVTFFHLPIHTVAGASLMGTLITSAAGVAFFQILSCFPLAAMQQIAPDYRLGLLFGAGGAVGIYLGARAQRYFSARLIKIILACGLFFTAGSYLIPK
ncbi:MAG: sulfite exporter TauE/SafE family protein [Proteobacteria bacterium]|nr:sulfite exporter TauE/SafE family protein [Pseudomonadota bacterium]MBU1234682.1 sulfite exporter TauE/SafE family protein [Pseudomonadota bacterium]MBU1417629.1 sulfite exporter TauE/SafE family protein [Pseudomonadota bacterium]MBU1456412.1 sulfite exporter TauE/SafE family protein [Pseudomonadota bacterium]